MQRTTRRWVTGAALSAGVLLVGVAPVLAQTDDDTGSPSTTSPAADEPAGAPAWVTTILDQLVASGTITQAQADAIAQAVQDARPDRGEHGRFGPRARLGLALDAAAEALGISLDELRADLREGKTLAEVAGEQGIDVQQVVDGLTAAAAARLDQAVADGRLTQEQADLRLQETTERIQELVNEPLPERRGHGPRGEGGGKDAAPSDDEGSTESTTPSSVPPTTAGS